jgi:hypothetical protein
MFKRTFHYGCVVLASALLAATASAGDRDATYYTNAFQQLGTSIAEIQTIDTTSAAATDLELVRTLRGQGQAFVASDKLDEAAPILERTSVVTRYARAKVERVGAEAHATAAVAAALAAEKDSAAVKAQAEAQQQRARELEARGL